MENVKENTEMVIEVAEEIGGLNKAIKFGLIGAGVAAVAVATVFVVKKVKSNKKPKIEVTTEEPEGEIVDVEYNEVQDETK